MFDASILSSFEEQKLKEEARTKAMRFIRRYRLKFRILIIIADVEVF